MARLPSVYIYLHWHQKNIFSMLFVPTPKSNQFRVLLSPEMTKVDLLGAVLTSFLFLLSPL